VNDPVHSPAKRKNVTLWIAMGVLLLALLAWISMERVWKPEIVSGAITSSRAGENRKSAPAPKDIGVASDQLSQAFVAVFGTAQRAKLTIGDDSFAYRPAKLLWVGDTAVLVSLGENVFDCHSCLGTVGIHYLKLAAGKFEMIGAWPRMIEGSGWGAATSGLSINHALSSYPVVMSDSGYTAQGCTSGGISLVELRPEGPSDWGYVHDHFLDQSGYGGYGGVDEVEGQIAKIRKDRSFDIVYTGDLNFAETYVRRGTKFVPTVKETRMPRC
jgi:hypothetical protein